MVLIEGFHCQMSKFHFSMSEFQKFPMSMSEFQSQCQMSKFQKFQVSNIKIWFIKFLLSKWWPFVVILMGVFRLEFRFWFMIWDCVLPRLVHQYHHFTTTAFRLWIIEWYTHAYTQSTLVPCPHMFYSFCVMVKTLSQLEVLKSVLAGQCSSPGKQLSMARG